MQYHVVTVFKNCMKTNKTPQTHYPSNISAKFQLGKTTKNK